MKTLEGELSVMRYAFSDFNSLMKNANELDDKIICYKQMIQDISQYLGRECKGKKYGNIFDDVIDLLTGKHRMLRCVLADLYRLKEDDVNLEYLINQYDVLITGMETYIEQEQVRQQKHKKRKPEMDKILLEEML